MRSLDLVRPFTRGPFLRMAPAPAIAGVLAVLLLGAGADAPRAESRRLLFPRPPLVPAAHEAGRDSSQFTSGDTVEIVARRPRLSLDPSVISRSPYLVNPDYRVRRPVPISVVLRPKTIELSRFSCLIHGADLGAGTASTIGGLGLLTGLWGEEATVGLMSAGAILGAIWGGTAGADDSNFRIRVGVDASDPAAHRSSQPSGDRRP